MIHNTLLALETHHLPCIIVDDGSDKKTKQQLEISKKQFPWVFLVTRPTNEGKGAAVLTGLNEAINQHYTHAIQIDADGQHNPNDISKFLTAITLDAKALIMGTPIYDASAPKSRLYGRKITNFWVAIETLSLEIQDAMCGYRAYPLNEIAPLIHRYNFGKGMNFDIEILVRAYWHRIKLIPLATKVTYPDDGSSHFKPWKDNLGISWLHTRLFFGMLKRLPSLLIDKHKKKADKNKHWSQLKETGCLGGLKFSLWSYKVLGRRITSLFLYPVMTYFYWTNSTARNASKQYLENLNSPTKLSCFKHFMSFGHMILDKLSVWNNDIQLDNINFPNKAMLWDKIAEHKGGIIMTAHLGNIEIARALSRFETDIKINAIVFHEQAQNLNTLLEQISPECKLNMIEVTAFDIKLAIELKEKVDAGEFIVIMGDRTSTTQPKRSTVATFLGKKAKFPQGPFILAGLLQCPIYFMLCLSEKRNRFQIAFEEFEKTIDISKTNREAQLAHDAQKYANLLEKYCKEYPLQWFNFFKFWE